MFQAHKNLDSNEQVIHLAYKDKMILKGKIGLKTISK